MNKDLIKKAVGDAEQELQDKQVQKIKDIVKSTLTKIKDTDDEIDSLKTQIKDLEDRRKLLRLDIDDLKDGRLDRIEERQKADEKARRTSVIVVEKEVHHHHHNDWWYQPYRITYVPYPPVTAPIYYSSGTTTSNSIFNALSSSPATCSDAVNASFTVNGSTTKNNTIGTYVIGTKVINLR
jgi:cell division protein FtsB